MSEQYIQFTRILHRAPVADVQYFQDFLLSERRLCFLHRYQGRLSERVPQSMSEKVNMSSSSKIVPCGTPLVVCNSLEMALLASSA